MSAASGSNQALNSALGVTLPWPVTAPPITTQRAMHWAKAAFEKRYLRRYR
jgi:hypothetical protein